MVVWYVILFLVFYFLCLCLSRPAAASEAPEDIQLVAVQMTLHLEDYWSSDAFTKRMTAIMGEVERCTDRDLPTLVVFPEDIGLLLVLQGMEHRLQNVHSVAAGIQALTKANLFPAIWNRMRYGLSWVPALYLRRHKTIAETYFSTFAQLARAHGVYIAAGSVVLPPFAAVAGHAHRNSPLARRVCNTSYLFGPTGEIIGKQDKVHLVELEQEAALDLMPGRLEDINVFATPLGRLGIAICLDAFQDDVVAALKAKGAQILIQPSANPGPWHKEQQADWLNSCHKRVCQQNGFVYGVNPMLNGPFWDIGFFGQSSIVGCATVATTPNSYAELPPVQGFLRLAASPETDEILVARVPHPDSVTPS